MNPVEVGIFGLVALVFCNSLYGLITEGAEAPASALVPMAASPVSENRQPAANSVQAFSQVELKCDAGNLQDTAAQKVRISGALCGLEQTTEKATIVKSQITNTSTRYTATVFTDLSRGKFSTDYIPLIAGTNTLHVEFVYPDGKSFSQNFAVNRL
jgi:hypothetical protein